MRSWVVLVDLNLIRLIDEVSVEVIVIEKVRFVMIGGSKCVFGF